MNGLPLNEIIHGDCLEVMRQFPDKSIDMILCDLPYGTTACEWDTVIPFEPLWEQYERIIKDNGAIVLFGNEPFSSYVRISNIKFYRYDWIWKKSRPTGFLNAKKIPLKEHENIMVFYKKLPIYNPQGIVVGNFNNFRKAKLNKNNDIYGKEKEFGISKIGNYPTTILEFPSVTNKERVHETQKPVALCEYLIKTYTLPGEVVLDNCIGSGTTAIACINTGRNFIGVEIEEKYVKIARERIEKHKKLDKMRLFPILELETGKLQYNKGLFKPEDESYGEG
jgi:site-specific DNA-methyltransferase (adenine-specific)